MTAEMPYRLEIPGQVSETQLRAIEQVARLVPSGGCVVEIGSLFGRSGWAWAKSVDPSAEVFCLDPWEGNEGVRPMELQLGIKYGLEQFRAYTADCPNIRPLKGYSPNDFRDWSRPVDLYYEDSVHAGPILAANLAFWSSHVVPTGVICGDDFRPRFPEVAAGAQAIAERVGRPLLQVENFWCVLPDPAQVPLAAEIAAFLQQLGAEADAEKRKLGFVPRIELGMPIDALPHDRVTVLRGRVSNDSLDPWPADPADAGGMVSLGIRIAAADGPEEVLAETRVSLRLASLEPDIPHPFQLVLPTAMLAPATYRATFTLVAGVDRDLTVLTAPLTIAPQPAEPSPGRPE
jgi:hypothetical protein